VIFILALFIYTNTPAISINYQSCLGKIMLLKGGEKSSVD